MLKRSIGVKIAAQRKLEHELGIPASEVPLEKFQCLTRIVYKAPSDGDVWGEHEGISTIEWRNTYISIVDYILFAQVDKISVNPNPSEVGDYKFVNAEELQALFDDASQGKIKLTPWFRLICNKFIWGWWKDLNNKVAFSYDPQIHPLE